MVVTLSVLVVLVVVVAWQAFEISQLRNETDRHFARLEADYVDGLNVAARVKRLERHADELWLEVEALEAAIVELDEKA